MMKSQRHLAEPRIIIAGSKQDSNDDIESSKDEAGLWRSTVGPGMDRKKRLLLAASILALATVGLIVAVVVVSRGGAPPRPNPEMLVEFFANMHPATAAALRDSNSPQYRAMEWLAVDVRKHSDATTQDINDYTIQRGVLAILYYSTLGDTKWKSRHRWLRHDEPECKWMGVKCYDKKDDTVVRAIELFENQLEGTIPLELSFLENLQVLKLYNNDIDGTIPEELDQLKFLEVLDLSSNYLTGTIPGSMPPELDVLDLATNRLEGSLPSSLMTTSPDISFIDVMDNYLEGSIPTEIGLLTNLDGLHLGSNQLTGTVPTEIGLLDDLEALTLEDNDLEGEIPDEVCDIGDDLTVIADCKGSDPDVYCDCCDNCYEEDE